MGTHPIFESDFDCLTERSWRSEIMKIEKATPRLHPITWISIGLNIFFSYYVLDLRLQAQVSSTLPPRPILPTADCSSAVNEALQNIHSGSPVHCPKIKYIV